MNNILTQEATKPSMRKPVHTKHTIKPTKVSLDTSKLTITDDVIKLFKESSAEFSEMYTPEYVKEKVSILISNRLRYQYENDLSYPNTIGIPNNIQISRADVTYESYRTSINVACVITSKIEEENWLFLFPMYLKGVTNNVNDCIYKKIETKYFDINKFPLDQIPKKRLAEETATEMTKKQFEDTVKTQRVSRTMSKL